MEDLRKPFFFAGVALIALTVLTEAGTTYLIKPPAANESESIAEIQRNASGLLPDADLKKRIKEGSQGAEENPPGLGIPCMAFLDGIVLYNLLLMLAALLAPERVQGSIQAVVTLVVSILILLGVIATFFVTLTKLFIMITLFTAAPFGTIAYMILFGLFPCGSAAAMLSVTMTFKLAAAACLVIAHQRFLQNKALVLIVLTSLLATVIVGWLHALVPTFLVSITDAVGALIVLILAGIWAIIMLIGAVIGIIKAIF